jgi:hypothetical protein
MVIFGDTYLSTNCAGADCQDGGVAQVSLASSEERRDVGRTGHHEVAIATFAASFDATSLHFRPFTDFPSPLFVAGALRLI